MKRLEKRTRVLYETIESYDNCNCSGFACANLCGYICDGDLTLFYKGNSGSSQAIHNNNYQK